MIRLFKVSMLACLLLTGPHAVAARSDVYVPESLSPWVDWVLKDRDYVDCPFRFNSGATGRADFLCAWPGELTIDANPGGGRFTQQWSVYVANAWIWLPGDAEHWPEGVTIDGRSAEVVMRDRAPAVLLTKGSHTIAGTFAWQERPRQLRIPRKSGLLKLTIDGRMIDRPERNDSGVWLGEREREREQKAEDTTRVRVYRLVHDDVPTRLTTVLMLDVSGSVREELLGPALPDGFVPLAIDSGLPSRLEPDGNLRLQVQPGSWRVALVARAGEVVNEIVLPSPQRNMPAEEIWSYQSNGQLRVTEATGLSPVDPTQVMVPDEWQRLPAFRVEPGDALTIVERGRGMLATENRLTLERQLWKDFNGEGLVFSDRVTGSMRSDWRLDMAAPFALMSASEGRENLLVTAGAEPGQTGVELRHTNVGLNAVGRIEVGGTLPVTGWLSRFDAVTTTLSLPPGHKLLAAPGADTARGSWVARWQLLDFFLLLITTIAALRLFGRTASVIAFLAVAMSLHEPGAPVWIWLNLLAAVALARVAPEGRLLRAVVVYRGVSFVALILIMIPFIAGQLRIGIYPQLEPQYGRGATFMQSSPSVAYEVSGDVAQSMALPGKAGVAEELVVTARKKAARIDLARYAPNAIVQAGPGRPNWSWNSYQLNWSGPVDPEREVRLIVLPRWVVSILRFIAVALLLGLTAVFSAEIFRGRWTAPIDRLTGRRASAASLVASILIAGGIAGNVADAADIPTPQILQQLEQRLLEPPDCAPRCAEIAAAAVDARGNMLRVMLTVHALDEVSVPLPGSLQGWRPEQVLLDGEPARQVSRDQKGVLWIRLSGGKHEVALRGAIPPVDSLELPFPAAPRATDVEVDGWFVAGLDGRRLASGSLQLTRLRDEGDSEEAAVRWESTRFPVFVRVERTVVLDLDWSVRTVVYRVAPEQGAISVAIPLLDGESVTSEDMIVTDGRVQLAMDPTQEEISWTSTLPARSPLSLHAATDQPWQEIWRVAISGIWHIAFDGVPESETDVENEGVRYAEFFPRGGESLTLDALRPAAIIGNTLAFDSVDVTTTIGDRSRNVTMQLAYRSTRGAQHAIRLPEKADITSVTIDGRSEPLRAESGELTLPIVPGEHRIEVAWRRSGDVGWSESTPDVDLRAPASNIRHTLQLADSRWVLGTNGPRLGPAVLYWSELAALILFAWILGRIPVTPLGTVQWLLLGIGFSTFSWAVLGLVAAWLLISGVRRKWTPQLSPLYFNIVQVLFGALTVFAVLAIVISLPSGLLGSPDMHVVGNDSYFNTLRWFGDRSEDLLPTAAVVSAPLWFYKVLILVWALWLSLALMRWLPWVWKSFVWQGLWHAKGTIVMPPVVGTHEPD